MLDELKYHDGAPVIRPSLGERQRRGAKRARLWGLTPCVVQFCQTLDDRAGLAHRPARLKVRGAMPFKRL